MAVNKDAKTDAQWAFGIAAAARSEERQRIVAWLRRPNAMYVQDGERLVAALLASAIEAGEHEEDTHG